MEAMDLLLMACHAQTLNLFVESFLRMVQKLMEDQNPKLQILATNSVRLDGGEIVASSGHITHAPGIFAHTFHWNCARSLNI